MTDDFKVTPRDAVEGPQGGGGQEASPGDWSAENNFGDDDGGVAAAECVSANEKDGQCAPFHLCYPVVFNAVTGELRNHGLARMLYQASGPCAKNESWSLQTVSVQVQPGVVSHVPLGE